MAQAACISCASPVPLLCLSCASPVHLLCISCAYPVHQAACISLIKWCKEDSASFGKIMREFDEGDGLDLEGRDTLAYANALYSGMSDGYGASKT